MNTIIITNTIEEDKLIINFNLQDGTLPFPPFELTTSGDIELNPLVLKLTELVELKREIEFEFIDSSAILKSSAKLTLVHDTLEEIYNSFNDNIKPSEEDSSITDDDFMF